MKTIVALLLAGLCTAQVPNPTMRDNHVTFSGAAIGFALNHFSISGGQPWGGITVQNNDIDIKAGRHGSAGPANDFKNGINAD